MDGSSGIQGAQTWAAGNRLDTCTQPAPGNGEQGHGRSPLARLSIRPVTRHALPALPSNPPPPNTHTHAHAHALSLSPPLSAGRRPFTFPPVERMGKIAVNVNNLTHGYNGRTLFRAADLVIERGERVAVLGPNGAGECLAKRQEGRGEDAVQACGCGWQCGWWEGVGC